MTYNPVLRGAGSFLKNPPFTQNFGPTNSAAASAGLPDILLRTPVPPLTWNSELTPAGQVQQPDPDYKATRAKQFNVVLEKELSGSVCRSPTSDSVAIASTRTRTSTCPR